MKTEKDKFERLRSVRRTILYVALIAIPIITFVYTATKSFPLLGGFARYVVDFVLVLPWLVLLFVVLPMWIGPGLHPAHVQSSNPLRRLPARLPAREPAQDVG
jgi:hypothetical protein